MSPVAVGVLIYLVFNNYFSCIPNEVKSAYKLYDLNTIKGIFEFTVYEPVHEEINYRGLVFLIILITGWLQNRNCFIGYKKYFKYAGYTLAWLVMIALDFFYANGHRYLPIAVLGFGFVWGYLTIRTRSLLYPIAFHCACNGIACLGLIISYHLIY